jgi:hypothetical protein
VLEPTLVLAKLVKGSFLEFARTLCYRSERPVSAPSVQRHERPLPDFGRSNRKDRRLTDHNLEACLDLLKATAISCTPRRTTTYAKLRAAAGMGAGRGPSNTKLMEAIRDYCLAQNLPLFHCLVEVQDSATAYSGADLMFTDVRRRGYIPALEVEFPNAFIRAERERCRNWVEATKSPV